MHHIHTSGNKHAYTGIHTCIRIDTYMRRFAFKGAYIYVYVQSLNSTEFASADVCTKGNLTLKNSYEMISEL